MEQEIKNTLKQLRYGNRGGNMHTKTREAREEDARESSQPNTARPGQAKGAGRTFGETLPGGRPAVYQRLSARPGPHAAAAQPGQGHLSPATATVPDPLPTPQPPQVPPRDSPAAWHLPSAPGRRAQCPGAGPPWLPAAAQGRAGPAAVPGGHNMCAGALLPDRCALRVA